MMLISWRMLSYFVVGKRHCCEDNALVNGIDVLCLKVFACSSRSQCSSRHSLASQGRQWTTISQNTLHLVILSSNLPTSFFSARIVCMSERRDSSLLCNCYCVYRSWINASQILLSIWISHTYFIRICILIMPKQQYLQPSIATNWACYSPNSQHNRGLQLAAHVSLIIWNKRNWLIVELDRNMGSTHNQGLL